MKKALSIVCLFALCLNLISCKKKDEEVKKYKYVDRIESSEGGCIEFSYVLIDSKVLISSILEKDLSTYGEYNYNNISYSGDGSIKSIKCSQKDNDCFRNSQYSYSADSIHVNTIEKQEIDNPQEETYHTFYLKNGKIYESQYMEDCNKLINIYRWEDNNITEVHNSYEREDIDYESISTVSYNKEINPFTHTGMNSILFHSTYHEELVPFAYGENCITKVEVKYSSEGEVDTEIKYAYKYDQDGYPIEYTVTDQKHGENGTITYKIYYK